MSIPLSPTPRRFHWIDAAALVGATALGLAMTKDYLESYDMMLMLDGGRFAPHGFQRWGSAAVPCFVSWSLIVLALQLRSPRPRLRRLARCPGVVTGLAVALLTLNVMAKWSAYHWKMGLPINVFGYRVAFLGLPSWLVETSEIAGFPVAATWFALWLGRWWRPEATWIDRAGRVLGVYWIAMFLIRSYYKIAS